MSGNRDFEPVHPSQSPRFAGISTFMRTVSHAISPEVDIGLVGVPFDLGVNYRSGAREGPGGVRQASRLIRRVHPVSGIKPFEICNVADLGDSPINPMSKDKSIALMEGFFGEIHAASIVPIAVGGDHTIPIPILRAIGRERPLSVLHFDAHTDTMDLFFDDAENHGTFLRRAHEEGLIDPTRVIQIGMRGSRFHEDDIRYSLDVGFTVITMDEFEEMGRAAAIRTISDTLGDGPVYISLDVDGLDPVHAPGTGVPEIGGLLPRDVQVMLRSLEGREIVGGDISEVVPSLDPSGITCVTAANLMWEMLCVTAVSVAAEKAGAGTAS